MRIVIANWKMNLLSKDIEAFCAACVAGYQARPGVEAGIAAPFVYLKDVKAKLLDCGVKVFAQNAHFEAKGAFTGEISMAQLKDLGCDGVLLGHSERRHIFGETNAALAKKLKAARAQGLLPVLCIGETLEERDGGKMFDVLREQLAILQEAGAGPLVVAYEPVWAIGTGRVATVEQIREVHAFVHEELKRLLGEAGAEVPIQYGGSVTPDNFPEIIQVPHVAGGLVGGAALVPEKFLTLLKQAQTAR
ncbi:MAG TPA: triose-phosphate isomerase [Holophaga sp.]|nr:triose-phosphate isomerase [Holophaga sp.]